MLTLSVNNPQGTPQEPRLKRTYYEEQTAKTPVRPISPVLHYRHGREFTDRYGLIVIFGTWLIAIFSAFPLVSLTERGYRRTAVCIFASLMIAGILGAASGLIGCLPWDWHRCLCDGQEHSEYHQTLQHDGGNVSRQIGGGAYDFA
jgi:hypothetical protein